MKELAEETGAVAYFIKGVSPLQSRHDR
jgi:hypothetical protein